MKDEVAAYCFNRAVMAFGLALEAEMDEARRPYVDKPAESTAAAQGVLNSWLNSDGSGKGMFRDPAKMMKL